MKLQGLAILFVILILPISITIGEYASFQIETFRLERLYDSRLITATHDALKTFQINTFNDGAMSDISDSKINMIEASASAFYNSLQSSFGLQGYSEEDLKLYVPALVYTMYDGYYIYSPYLNIAEWTEPEHEDDEGVLKIDINATNDKVDYGFKPYVYYSCRYVVNDIDVIINYSLDNYITVQGTIAGEPVYKSGYLLTLATSLTDRGLYVKDNKSNDPNEYYYNGQRILPEAALTDALIEVDEATGDIGTKAYKYVKLNGNKYYWNEEQEEIFYISEGLRKLQASKKESEEMYNKYVYHMELNRSAINYYKNAYEFTTWVNNKLGDLKTKDAAINLLSSGEEKIFQNKNIEYSNSNFNLHRKEVIRHSIESNLSVAIANFNTYTSAGANFQMPKLKENEWEMLENEISIISFLQGLNLGGKLYNGYTVVTNSKTQEVVKEERIYLTTNDGYYHKINDNGLKNGKIDTSAVIDGFLDLDFETRKDTNTGEYYILKSGLASYSSIVGQEDVNNEFNSIYEYLQNSGLDDRIEQIYYRSLARERFSMFKVENDSQNENIMWKMAPSQEYEIVTDGLIRHYEAGNVDGYGNAGDSSTTILTDLSGNFLNAKMNGATAKISSYVLFDGIDDWIECGNLVNTRFITLEASFVLNSLPTGNTYDEMFTIIGNVEDKQGASLFVLSDGTWGFRANIKKSETQTEEKIIIVPTEESKLKIGKSYQISATYDGTIMKIYLNGQRVEILNPEDAEISGEIGNKIDESLFEALGKEVKPCPLGIGVDTSIENALPETAYASMNFYSARVYNRALTDDEIEHNYNNTKIILPDQEEPEASPEVTISTEPPATWANTHSATIKISDEDDGLAIGATILVGWSTDASISPTSWNTIAIGTDNYVEGDKSAEITTVGNGYDGEYYLWVKAENVQDLSGNFADTTAKCKGPFLFDNTNPGITITPNGNTEYLSSQTATIEVTDEGSGVEKLIYKWTPLTSTPIMGKEEAFFEDGIVVNSNSVEAEKNSPEGKWVLWVLAYDKAGNRALTRAANTFNIKNTAECDIEIINTDGNTTGIYEIPVNSSIEFKKQIQVTSADIDVSELTIQYSFQKGNSESPIYSTGVKVNAEINYSNFGTYYLKIRVLDSSGNVIATKETQYVFNGALTII